MDKRQYAVAGVVLALMAGLSMPAGAREPVRATPLERCTVETSHKLYTRADADFHAVLAWLDVELGSGPRHARGIEPKRLPARPMGFSVTLETRQCRLVPAGPGAWAPEPAPLSAKECVIVGCGDPAPGTNAPEGSIMVIDSCDSGRRTTATYERVDGRWVLVGYSQEASTQCSLDPDRPAPEGR
ncbi:hypothetical protein K3217_14780 [bacterium BD-1]|uniref:hypothetical protein n=1 Tax=Arenimonas sp. TaxID=1872635 RepID=UPI001E3ECBF7|nr:hypothetical protein [Ottowia caeni]